MDISILSQMASKIEAMKALKDIDRESAHRRADEILISALIMTATLTKDKSFHKDVRDLIKEYQRYS